MVYASYMNFVNGSTTIALEAISAKSVVVLDEGVESKIVAFCALRCWDGDVVRFTLGGHGRFIV